MMMYDRATAGRSTDSNLVIVKNMEEETQFSDDLQVEDLESNSLPIKKKSLAFDVKFSNFVPGGDDDISPQSVKKSIHQLARDGDLEMLTQLLSVPNSDYIRHINDLDEKKLTPLHYAARHCNIEAMKILVDYGASIDKLGDDDMTPLHYASRYGKKTIPKEKKKNSSLTPVMTPRRRLSVNEDDPDADATDINGENGGEIMNFKNVVKSIKDHLAKVDEIIDYLIEKGADLNAQDKYGMTPLHHTAIRGNQDALKALLKSPGIVMEPTDAQGSTPLHLAATYNQPEVAKTLLTTGNATPEARDADQRTPLHEACQEGSTEVVKVLLEEAEKKFGKSTVRNMIHDKDDDGASPLFLGVGKGGTEIVQLLLSSKANPNQKNHENNFPVHSAARTGDLNTLRLLVEYGAAFDCLNLTHQTPLYLAAENNNLGVMKYLLHKGADINRWSIKQITPIMIAAIEGHHEAVELLLNQGAKFDLCDKDDRSALFHAANKNEVNVLKILLKHPDRHGLLEITDNYDNLPIHTAAEEGHIESVKFLIESNSPIGRKNEDEQTPLHLACINGRIDVVKEILRADRNEIMNEDEDSNTPLHLACMNNNHKTVDVLLRFGGEVHSRNTKKWTPLDCAASVGAVKCAKLLLNANATIDPVDRTKTTPLHLAAENGHAKMINLLLDHGANITMEDSQSRNALERAILSGNKNCAKTILEHRDWKTAMRTTHPGYDPHGVVVPETPMRLLIKRYPDLAEMVFDNCITKKKQNLETEIDPFSSPKNILMMDYEFIDDAFYIKAREDQFFTFCDVDERGYCQKFKKPYHKNSKVVMDNHPFIIMAKEKKKNLLRHPLCLALVRRKWLDYGRYLYYLGLLFYCIFLVFLTSYALLTPNARRSNFSDDTSGRFCENSPTFEDMKAYEELNTTWFFEICHYGIIVISACHLFLELVQCFRTRSRYIAWTNVFDWIVFTLAIVAVIDFEDYFDQRRTCVQWETLAVVCTLAWLNLLGDVRQLPYLGIYVIMFFDILKTFLQFVVVFLIFIVAFALGFHLLLINQTPFQDVLPSLLKTTVMMIGEFEYEGIFHGEQKLEFPSMTYLLFILFLIFMSTIIVNLMIGLAVDDIKAVQEEAILKRLAMQAELILDVERLLPQFMLKRLIKQFEQINPKRKKWWHVMKDVVSTRSIVKDAFNIGKTRDGNEAVLETLENLQDTIKNLNSELKSQAVENHETRQMVQALFEKNKKNNYVDLVTDDVRL